MYLACVKCAYLDDSFGRDCRNCGYAMSMAYLECRRVPNAINNGECVVQFIMCPIEAINSRCFWKFDEIKKTWFLQKVFRLK